MNADTMCGWFVMLLGGGREALCYRCNCCGIFSMLGDGPARAFCCGKWKTPPKEGFWGTKLPRLPYIAPRALTVMPGNGFEITE
jgi:hypothetical protein